MSYVFNYVNRGVEKPDTVRVVEEHNFAPAVLDGDLGWERPAAQPCVADGIVLGYNPSTGGDEVIYFDIQSKKVFSVRPEDEPCIGATEVDDEDLFWFDYLAKVVELRRLDRPPTYAEASV